MKRLPIMLLVAVLLMAFTTVYAGDTPASASAKSATAGCKGHMTPEQCAKKCGMTPEQCAKKCGMTPEECAKMCAGKQNCGVARISVKGMTCGGCEKTISAALAGIDGVHKVINVDHEEGMAVICIDPTQVKDADMTTAIVNKGYKAEIIPAVAKSEAVVSGAGYKCGPEAAKMCGASKKGCGASKKSGCGGSKSATISGGKAPE